MKLVPEDWLNNFGTSRGEFSFPSKKWSQLWEKVRDRLDLNQQQRVVYEDGVIGSPLVDLFEYFTLPASRKKPRPYDSDRFLAVCIETGVKPPVVDGRFASFLEKTDINSTPGSPKLSAWKSY